MIDHDLMVTLVSTIVLGVASQVVAERSKLPSIIFLLSAGILFGPDGVNFVQPSLLNQGLYAVTALSIAIILFEGGLTLNIKSVRLLSRSIINLITIGAIVTWGGAAVISWLVLDISWTLAILFGSLVIVTGPTVIGPLLRTVRVKKEIATILRWEGILIDPVGAIIAVLVLGFVTAEEATFVGTLGGFFGRLVLGTVMGVLGGYLMAQLMKFKLSESISTLTIFAIVFMMFGASELLMKESGIMTVTIAGIVMGNMKVPNLNIVKGFKEKITILMVSVLFILLAANLRLIEIFQLGWKGLAVVAGLIFIVRPLNIWTSVHDSAIDLKGKLFLSWIAPRGIIAAAVASLFSFTLQRHGYAEASLLSSLTFLTIGATVLVQGGTALGMARLLGQLRTGARGVAILGGNSFACALAKELNSHDIATIIIDSNKRNCVQAEEEGIAAYTGSILDETLWEDLDLTPFGSFLAVTSNNELNSLACQRANEYFARENVYQIRHSYKNELHPFSLHMIAGNQHYDLALDVNRISTELRIGTSKITSVSRKDSGGSDATGGELICGISRNRVRFTADPALLTTADAIVKIVRV